MLREDVRQAFATAVKAVYTGDHSRVYTSRITDNRDDAEHISVYLKEGDVDQSFAGDEIEADLVIEYVKQGATDAQLDTLADAIVAQVKINAAVRAAVKRPLWSRFEYDRDASSPAIILEFRVIF